MRIARIVMAASLIMMIGGCENYIIEKPVIPPGISFSLDVQPIFDAKCMDCHSGLINPNLTYEESHINLINGGFINTDDPESSIIYEKLRESHSSRATEEEKLIILLWITEGAENN